MSIFRYEPHKQYPAHTHSGGEEFIVLEGTWNDDFGTTPALSYVRNYIGSSHSPSIGEDGCLIFVKLRQMSLEVEEPGHSEWDLNDHEQWPVVEVK